MLKKTEAIGCFVLFSHRFYYQFVSYYFPTNFPNVIYMIKSSDFDKIKFKILNVVRFFSHGSYMI